MGTKLENFFRKYLFFSLAGANIILFGILIPLNLNVDKGTPGITPYLIYSFKIVLYQFGGSLVIFGVFIFYALLHRALIKPVKKVEESIFSDSNTMTKTLSFKGNFFMTGLRFSSFLFLVTLAAFILYFLVAHFLLNFPVPTLAIFIVLSYPFFRVMKF